MKNQEKAQKYTLYIKRFNKAVANEFYLEAMWILYAMIEDRTSAFLYHIGFTSEKNRNKITSKSFIKKEIRGILQLQGKGKIYLKSLSNKFCYIKQVFDWAKNVVALGDFQKDLKGKILKIITEEFSDNVNYLNNVWRNKRNVLTHSLFTTANMKEGELACLVEQGYMAIRIFDKMISQLKKGVNIREKFRIL